MNKLICITTGDLDGIGLEVTLKALEILSNSLNKNAHFFLFLNPIQKSYFNEFISNNRSVFQFIEVENSDLNNLKTNSSNSKMNSIFYMISNQSPAYWIEYATKLAIANLIDGIVTGPISKKLTYSLGHSDLGHNDIFKRLTGIKNSYMYFKGEKFNVLLATGHIPICKITEYYYDRFFEIIEFSQKFHSSQNFNKPIGLVGLNPHAGDQGLIGDSEFKIKINFLRSNNNLNVSEFLVPDVAFKRENWNLYSFYLAAYHDQGLIPFKMIHGFEGCQISLGFPFIRTSVDHGVANDIFSKKIANPSSMIYAIKSCIQLIENKGSNHV